MKLAIQKLLELLEKAKERIARGEPARSVLEYEIEPAIEQAKYVLSRLD